MFTDTFVVEECQILFLGHCDHSFMPQFYNNFRQIISSIIFEVRITHFLITECHIWFLGH